MRELLSQQSSKANTQQDAINQFAAVQLARCTDDRYRDLPTDMRELAIDWLANNEAPEHTIQLVREGGELDSEEQNRIFGEALPSGLRIL